MPSQESPNAGRVQAETELEVVASAYVKMWNDRDYAAIPRLVSESFVMYDPAASAAEIPGPKGEVHGRDGLRQFMELLTTSFSDFEITVLEMLTGEDVAMYEVQLTMTHDGPLGALPPTGRQVQLRGVSILRIDAGIITEHRFHTNMTEATEQLGLTFPQILGQLPKLVVGKARRAL
ncbi:ester cyclase [Haloferax elongans]|uniref:ester cyclase n=1 Tax=Haloferax elongans TaxID=403191 RepID=UPI000B0B161B|nr:ester cyclase [Haloferax elongans]